MTKQLVSRAELARRAGVSRPAATKACKGPLAEAMDGDRVDLAHPTVVAYLEKQGNAPTPGAVKAKSRPVVGGAAEKTKRKDAALERHAVHVPAAPPPPEDAELDQKFAAYFDYTVRDVVRKFGTDGAFVDFLKAAKTIEDITEKQLKNAEKKGELIHRDIVRKGILEGLDGAFRRMLTDGAKTIAVRCKALADTGASSLELEQQVAKQMSTFLKPCKAKLERAIKNA